MDYVRQNIGERDETDTGVDVRVVTMPTRFTKVATFLLASAGALSSTASDVQSLVCSFGPGVGISQSRGIFQTSDKPKRYSFRIPSGWRAKTGAPNHATALLKWTNLNDGWDGDATAILNGRMVSIVENAFNSDNAFYVHIWLDQPDSKDTVTALYLVAGRNDLPKEYEAPSIRNGRCEFR